MYPSHRPEYRAWRSMLDRCYNAKRNDFSRWGGRGIRVCDRWRESYDAFLGDVGPRPDGHTLERIDNCGNYEPGNVRWATRKEQAQNRRPHRGKTLIVINGETRSIAQWARQAGLPYDLLYYRLTHGWAPHLAVSTPEGVSK